MATNFGKTDFETTFNPITSCPIDARTYFESYEEALAAAQSAVIVNTPNVETSYYIGQILSVVDPNTKQSEIYTISKDSTGKITLINVPDEIKLEQMIYNATNTNTDAVIDLYNIGGSIRSIATYQHKTNSNYVDVYFAKQGGDSTDFTNPIVKRRYNKNTYSFDETAEEITHFQNEISALNDVLKTPISKVFVTEDKTNNKTYLFAGTYNLAGAADTTKGLWRYTLGTTDEVTQVNSVDGKLLKNCTEITEINGVLYVGSGPAGILRSTDYGTELSSTTKYDLDNNIVTTAEFCSSIYYDKTNNTYYAGFLTTGIYSSVDGISWYAMKKANEITTITIDNINKVNDTLIATGKTGMYYYDVSDETWKIVEQFRDKEIYSTAVIPSINPIYTDIMFTVVLKKQKTIWYSYNGLNWKNVNLLSPTLSVNQGPYTIHKLTDSDVIIGNWAEQYCRCNYISNIQLKLQFGGYVTLMTDETIQGQKTFSQDVIVPRTNYLTDSYAAATKSYVDEHNVYTGIEASRVSEDVIVLDCPKQEGDIIDGNVFSNVVGTKIILPTFTNINVTEASQFIDVLHVTVYSAPTDSSSSGFYTGKVGAKIYKVVGNEYALVAISTNITENIINSEMEFIFNGAILDKSEQYALFLYKADDNGQISNTYAPCRLRVYPAGSFGNTTYILASDGQSSTLNNTHSVNTTIDCYVVSNINVMHTPIATQYGNTTISTKQLEITDGVNYAEKTSAIVYTSETSRSSNLISETNPTLSNIARYNIAENTADIQVGIMKPVVENPGHFTTSGEIHVASMADPFTNGSRSIVSIRDNTIAEHVVAKLDESKKVAITTEYASVEGNIPFTTDRTKFHKTEFVTRDYVTPVIEEYQTFEISSYTSRYTDSYGNTSNVTCGVVTLSSELAVADLSAGTHTFEITRGPITLADLYDDGMLLVRIGHANSETLDSSANVGPFFAISTKHTYCKNGNVQTILANAWNTSIWNTAQGSTNKIRLTVDFTANNTITYTAVINDRVTITQVHNNIGASVYSLNYINLYHTTFANAPKVNLQTRYDINNVIHNYDDETIEGQKTFTQDVIIPETTDDTPANAAITKTYFDKMIDINQVNFVQSELEINPSYAGSVYSITTYPVENTNTLEIYFTRNGDGIAYRQNIAAFDGIAFTESNPPIVKKIYDKDTNTYSNASDITDITEINSRLVSVSYGIAAIHAYTYNNTKRILVGTYYNAATINEEMSAVLGVNMISTNTDGTYTTEQVVNIGDNTTNRIANFDSYSDINDSTKYDNGTRIAAYTNGCWALMDVDEEINGETVKVLYAGVNGALGSTVIRSTDGGTTWKNVTRYTISGKKITWDSADESNIFVKTVGGESCNALYYDKDTKTYYAGTSKTLIIDNEPELQGIYKSTDGINWYAMKIEGVSSFRSYTIAKVNGTVIATGAVKTGSTSGNGIMYLLPGSDTWKMSSIPSVNIFNAAILNVTNTASTYEMAFVAEQGKSKIWYSIDGIAWYNYDVSYSNTRRYYTMYSFDNKTLIATPWASQNWSCALLTNNNRYTFGSQQDINNLNVKTDNIISDIETLENDIETLENTVFPVYEEFEDYTALSAIHLTPGITAPETGISKHVFEITGGPITNINSTTAIFSISKENNIEGGPRFYVYLNKAQNQANTVQYSTTPIWNTAENSTNTIKFIVECAKDGTLGNGNCIRYTVNINNVDVCKYTHINIVSGNYTLNYINIYPTDNIENSVLGLNISVKKLLISEINEPVRIYTNQTINGQKTFTQDVIIPETTLFTMQNAAVSKSYVDNIEKCIWSDVNLVNAFTDDIPYSNPENCYYTEFDNPLLAGNYKLRFMFSNMPASLSDISLKGKALFRLGYDKNKNEPFGFTITPAYIYINGTQQSSLTIPVSYWNTATNTTNAVELDISFTDTSANIITTINGNTIMNGNNPFIVVIPSTNETEYGFRYFAIPGDTINNLVNGELVPIFADNSISAMNVDLYSDLVCINSNQTISGQKTFLQDIIIPETTSDTVSSAAVTKGYVDEQIVHYFDDTSCVLDGPTGEANNSGGLYGTVFNLLTFYSKSLSGRFKLTTLSMCSATAGTTGYGSGNIYCRLYECDETETVPSTSGRYIATSLNSVINRLHSSTQDGTMVFSFDNVVLDRSKTYAAVFCNKTTSDGVETYTPVTCRMSVYASSDTTNGNACFNGISINDNIATFSYTVAATKTHPIKVDISGYEIESIFVDDTQVVMQSDYTEELVTINNCLSGYIGVVEESEISAYRLNENSSISSMINAINKIFDILTK